MRIFTRMVDHDPVVIWEQMHNGHWSQFIADLHDHMLDISEWINGEWTHTETHALQEN